MPSVNLWIVSRTNSPHSTRSYFKTFWDTQDCCCYSYFRIWKCKGILLFWLQRRKNTQADISFRSVSAFIFPFTKVMLQLGDKLLACKVLVSLLKTYSRDSSSSFPYYSSYLSKVLANNPLFYILHWVKFYLFTKQLFFNLNTLLKWQVLNAITMFQLKLRSLHLDLPASCLLLEDHLQHYHGIK